MASGSRQLRRDTRGFLAGLGPNPNAVAGTLDQMGISGSPVDPEMCAVANYLRLIIGAEPSVGSVRVCNSHVLLRLDDQPHRRIAIRLPSAVRQFIVAFDEHFYPNLEHKEAPGGAVRRAPPIRPSSEA